MYENKIQTVDGVKTDYSKIPAGSAFRYLNCEETGYTQIVAYTEKINGEILSIDYETVNISETEYRMSKDLLNIIDKNEVEKDEPEYDPDKVLEVGDFITATISGSTASNWSMVLKQTVVPEIADNTEDSEDVDYNRMNTTQFYGQGVIKKVDNVSQYILVEFNNKGAIPILARCKVLVDPVDHKCELVTIADLQEGDRVYMLSSYGRAAYVIKNADL